MNKYSFTNNGRTFERVSKAMTKMVRGKTMIKLLDSTGNIFAEGNSIREILNELNSDSEWYYIYRPDNYTVDAYYAPNEKEADNDINGENADEIYDVINIKCDGKRV